MTVVSPIPAAAGHWDELDAIRALETATRDRLHSLEGVEGRVAFGVAAQALVAVGDECPLLIVPRPARDDAADAA
jgi:hypothetical protein